MAELKSADAVGITNANLTLQLSKGVALEEMHRIVPHIAKLDFQSIDERMFSANIGVLDKDEISYFGARLFLPARLSVAPERLPSLTVCAPQDLVEFLLHEQGYPRSVFLT